MLSTCVKCGGHLFNVEVVEPNNARYQKLFVQCTACGVPAGVTETYEIGVNLDRIESKLDELSNSINVLEHNLRVLGQTIGR